MKSNAQNSKSEDGMKNPVVTGLSGNEKPHTNEGTLESCASLKPTANTGRLPKGKAEKKQDKETARVRTKAAAKKQAIPAKSEDGGLNAALEALINNQQQPKLRYADEPLGIRSIDVCHAAEQEHLGLSGLLGLKYADRFAAEMWSDGKLLYYYYNGGYGKRTRWVCVSRATSTS